jgi:hypothetical protein
MAIKPSANYSKKIGLPQFSSHSFSASVEIELTDITQAEAEIQKRYQFNAFTESLKDENLAEVPKRTEALQGLLDTHVGLAA